MSTSAPIYQRETVDWRALDVLRTPPGQPTAPYAGDWSYQIVPYGSRPTGSYTAAVELNGVKGVNISGLSAGTYWVFIRIDGQTPYVPIQNPLDLIIE